MLIKSRPWLITLLLAYLLLVPCATRENKKIIRARVGNSEYRLEVADTYLLRSQGLSGRRSMPKNEGMLFVFPRPGTYGFVMAGMHFGLDFIFLRKGKIVDLIENVPPPPQKHDHLISKTNFDRAIELNAGQIKNSHIKIGNLIRFLPPR
jgi:hypothetical protein